MKFLVALLLIVIASAAQAQPTAQKLNALSGASALGRTDTIPVCQTPANCTTLAPATVAQVNTYLSEEQVNCTNTAASDPGLIATAVATGRNVHIVGTCNFTTATGPIVLNTQGQIIRGDSINLTILNVGTHIIPTGLFQCATPVVSVINGPGYNQFGPIVRQMRIVFTQVNSATRGALTAFTPAFQFTDCYNAWIENVRMEECMICVDARGQSGQSIFRRLEMSPLSVGIWVDGSAAPILLDNVQFQPYGAELYGTGNCNGPGGGLCTLFDTTNPGCTPETTSGTDGPIGLMVGRMDDMDIHATLFFIGQGMCSFNGATGHSEVTISDSGFDSFGGLVSTGDASIRMVGVYFGTIGILVSGTQYSIYVPSGDSDISCDGCKFYRAGALPNSSIVTVSGTLTIAGGVIYNGGGQADIIIEGTSHFNLHGATVRGTASGLGLILVNHSTTTAVANIGGLLPADAGGGSLLMSVGQDNDHRIVGNGLNGWINVCPSTQTNMRSIANGTAANATCN